MTTNAQPQKPTEITARRNSGATVELITRDAIIPYTVTVVIRTYSYCMYTAADGWVSYYFTNRDWVKLVPILRKNAVKYRWARGKT